MRPYYKFVLPPEDVNTEEQDVWWVKLPVIYDVKLCSCVLMRRLHYYVLWPALVHS